MTKSKKQIYLVYSCDDWVSTGSFQLRMATTSKRKLKSYVAKAIKDDRFEYSWTNNESKTKQVSEFKRDFECVKRCDINNKLKYGYIDYCYDGEEI